MFIYFLFDITLLIMFLCCLRYGFYYASYEWAELSSGYEGKGKGALPEGKLANL